MASYRWKGSTSGVWKLAANWRDLDGGAVVTYPGETALTYDDVYFDMELAGGEFSCEGVSALTEELKSIYIGGTYNGTIGSAITPVEVDLHTTQPRSVIIDAAAAGAIHIKGMSAGASLIHQLYVLSGTVYLYGKIVSAYLLKGTVVFDAGINLTSQLWIGYITTQQSDVNLTIPAGATLPATINCNGGMIICNAVMTNLNLSAGTWVQNGDLDTIYQTGGTYNMANSVTNAYIYGGTFDGRGTIIARTITSAWCGSGATMYLNPTSANITVTTGVKMLGGMVYWSAGKDIAAI
jgi:hypothetical protein